MTAINVPDRLLSLQDWDQLPEDGYRWAELATGVVEVSPGPAYGHQRIVFRLMQQLELAGSTYDLVPVFEVDVIIDPAFPPTVRQPDVSVVARSAALFGTKRFSAGELPLAIEVVSPGSARRDRVTKLAEYANAGIPHYWIVDVSGPAAVLDAFDLDGGRYQLVQHAKGATVTFDPPFAITLDLDLLRT